MGSRLSEAGWFEGRSVECSTALSRLNDEGHPVEEWFERFVAEYDGITVEFTHEGRRDEVVLDVAEAGRKWYPQDVVSFEGLLGERLLPIGYTYHEHLLLLVTSSGEWFGGYDNELWRLGANANEAVERLLVGGPFDSAG